MLICDFSLIRFVGSIYSCVVDSSVFSNNLSYEETSRSFQSSLYFLTLPVLGSKFVIEKWISSYNNFLPCPGAWICKGSNKDIIYRMVGGVIFSMGGIILMTFWVKSSYYVGVIKSTFIILPFDYNEIVTNSPLSSLTFK